MGAIGINEYLAAERVARKQGIEGYAFVTIGLLHLASTAVRDGPVTTVSFTSEGRVPTAGLRTLSGPASGSPPVVDITEKNTTATTPRPQPTFNKQIEQHTSQPVLTWFGSKHVARERQAIELNNAISKARDDRSSHNSNTRSSRRPASLEIVIAPLPRTPSINEVTNGGSSRYRTGHSAAGHFPLNPLRHGSACSTRDLVDAADVDASIRPSLPTTPPSLVSSRLTQRSSENPGGWLGGYIVQAWNAPT